MPGLTSIDRIALNVHLYVTPICNLSCPHCYYDALERVTPPRKLMSNEEIASLLREIAREFNPDVHLEGGEPFLREDLPELLEALPDDVLRTITITTNGTVKISMSDDLLRRLGGLRVSIDGHTDELQKELRGTSLRPVLRTCKALTDGDVPFTVRKTVWSGNAGALDRIFAMAEDHRIRRLSLYEFQPAGRAIGTDLLWGLNDRMFDGFLDALCTLTPPTMLDFLSFNAAERRVDAVMAAKDRLADQGFEVIVLPDVASCTINYDSTVGVSAWTVTAAGAVDEFTSATSEGFVEGLLRSAQAGQLHDPSPFTSKIQVRRRADLAEKGEACTE